MLLGCPLSMAAMVSLLYSQSLTQIPSSFMKVNEFKFNLTVATTHIVAVIRENSLRFAGLYHQKNLKKIRYLPKHTLNTVHVNRVYVAYGTKIEYLEKLML